MDEGTEQSIEALAATDVIRAIYGVRLERAEAERIMAIILAPHFDSLRAQLAEVRRELSETQECLLLTRGELDAIKNAPPEKSGANICGHDRYWIGRYGTCMCCRAEKFAQDSAINAMRADQAIAERERMRGELQECLELFEIQAQSEKMLGFRVDPALVERCERDGYGATIQGCVIAWTKKDPVGALTIGHCLLTVKKTIERLRKLLNQTEGQALQPMKETM